MNYESRSDLLIAAGESIKMQEAVGIDPVGKYAGDVVALEGYKFDDLAKWEFPIAVVEGKAVFVGDELWVHGAKKIISCAADVCGCSWLPPKPRTGMVELLREDAQNIASDTLWNDRISNACKKALDADK